KNSVVWKPGNQTAAGNHYCCAREKSALVDTGLECCKQNLER
ncbi:hypothetical protein JD844_001027, partial [Phrynosoma platyrhinos]